MTHGSGAGIRPAGGHVWRIGRIIPAPEPGRGFRKLDPDARFLRDFRAGSCFVHLSFRWKTLLFDMS